MTDYQQQVQLQLPSPSRIFTPLVTAILVLMVIGYTLIHHATDFTIQYLAISRSGVFSGKIWQLITYVFINGCVWNFIFNSMVVLFVGSMVEREWGSRGFLFLALTVCLVCAVGWLLVSLVLNRDFLGIGTESLVYGLITAFGMLFRKQKFWFFFFITEAQTIALILIGLGLVIGIARPISWVWVAGALVAYLYIKARWAYIDRAESSIPASDVRNGGFVDID